MITANQNNIPNDWKTAKISDIFDISNGLWVGKTSDKVLCKVLRNTNFSNDGHIDLEDIAEIDVDKKALQSRELNFGDIVIEKSGGSDVQPVGRVVYFDIRQNGYSFSNFTSRLRPKENNKSKFYFYFLYNFWLIGETKQFQRQTTGIRNLDFNTYQDVLVPVPPQKEQEAIVKILDTLDEEICKTNEIITQTENLKNGISHHLFTKGIGHSKFQKTKIGDIPKDWSFLKMKDICTVRQGLQIPISKRFKDSGENRYKYITLKNLKDDTYEYIESPKESVICKRDDVLMTRTGNTGVVVTDVEGVFHNNFFLIDFDRKIIDKNYLVYYLRSEPIKKLLLERAGTTTIPDLNHGAFYGIHFLLPDITEQKKISDILSSIDKKISFNKEVREKLTKLKKGLMQDLLSGKVRTK
ncbi:MAG: restriction endonuclease subunit S [Patescibacteria group bacterium]|nr:restriction endonuclease subunit S [Patescibacteria group bacterium]